MTKDRDDNNRSKIIITEIDRQIIKTKKKAKYKKII